jgi:serine/threonine-protein kinase
MSPEVPAANVRDERLAQLLAEFTDKKRKGQSVDLRRVAEQHPDLVDELRQLLTVGQIAEEFGKSAVHEQPTEPQAGPIAPAVNLPRRFGEYDLLEEIGRGGMGVVYKAWEPRLRRFVALKMVRGGELASAVDLSRFRTEAQAAAGIAHANIVPVYEVGTCDGQAYFTMKYVDGPTLAARVIGGPLPQREAVRLMRDVSRAVHEAHRAGILHRDLKPSNVLLDQDGRPLVADFGLAKRFHGEPGALATGGLTQTGHFVGTPSYMAPEQAGGGRGTPGVAADVYSLGAIFYELLTGRPPFQAASAMDTVLLVQSEEAVRPRLLNPKIDPDLEMVCLRCLEKRPDHRYPSAGALADDLDAYLQGEPVSARSSSLGYFVSRLLRDTHHAAVLENWGLLWMWHSLMLLLLCLVTNVMLWSEVRSPWPYLALWSIGLVTWGSIFWGLRRRGGPVTFVERQIAHAWAAGVAATIASFWVELLLGRPVLELSPFLPVIAGMVFLFKAGTLSGWFYVAAAASFLTALPMLYFPAYGPLIFGVVSAACFFFPGLRYYLQKKRTVTARLPDILPREPAGGVPVPAPSPRP